MRIDLDEVRRNPVRWSETLNIDPADLETTEIVSLSPVETSGVAEFTDPNYRVQGQVGYSQTLSCYRCLSETELHVEDGFSYLIDRRRGAELAAEQKARDDAGPGQEAVDLGRKEPKEIQLASDDLEMIAAEDDELDLAMLVREQILLNLPMKSVCRAECKGLCSECGADLNQGSCDCREVSSDPRWSGLAAIRDELEH